MPRKEARQAPDEPVGGGRQEEPAQDDGADGARADDDVGEPVRAAHDARQGEEEEDGEAGERPLKKL